MSLFRDDQMVVDISPNQKIDYADDDGIVEETRKEENTVNTSLVLYEDLIVPTLEEHVLMNGTALLGEMGPATVSDAEKDKPVEIVPGASQERTIEDNERGETLGGEKIGKEEKGSAGGTGRKDPGVQVIKVK